MSKTKCAHCQLSFDKTQMIKGDGEASGLHFCCVGCAGVWQILNQSGLKEFYSRLGKNTLSPINDGAQSPTEQAEQESDAAYSSYISQENGTNKITLIIDGVHCSACVWLIEKVLKNQACVLEAGLNASNHKLHLRYDPSISSLSALINLIKSIGYRAVPFDDELYEQIAQKSRRKSYAKLLVGLFGTMNIMWMAIARYSGYFSGMSPSMHALLNFAEFVLATPVLFYTGSAFFAGLKSAFKLKRANMDSLVASGASLTYFYSVYAMLTRQGEVYFDSVAMIITFVFIGKFLQSLSLKNSSDALDSLRARMPSLISVIKDDKIISKRPEDVKIGDTILLKSGQMALIDGLCISSKASLDNAYITGESVPVELSAGQEILSGAVAVGGSVVYKATNTSAHSLMGRLLELLSSSLSKKPRIEELANKLASGFSASVLVVAGLSFAYYANTKDIPHALLICVSIIVIACPCALSLATPIATLVATRTGLNRGVLFRYASIIEALASCDTIVFDKTGTLSKAKLKVKELSCFGELDLGIVLALAQHSSHPVSKAVAAYLASTHSPAAITDVKEISARGLRAKFNGLEIISGSALFLKELGLSLPYEASGYYFGLNGVCLAHFSLADELRDEAKKSLSELKKMGLELHLLSGDSLENVKKVADELEISNFQAACLPQEKASYIENLNQAKKGVLMVGDGINDTLALALARVGVAMGSGTDASLKSSDVVLLKDELSSLTFSIKLAKECMKTVRVNIAFCLLYNALVIPLAIAGQVIPLVAAISMSASSLVVVLNSLWLGIKFKGKSSG